MSITTESKKKSENLLQALTKTRWENNSLATFDTVRRRYHIFITASEITENTSVLSFHIKRPVSIVIIFTNNYCF